jgi:hypothetical protein
MSSSHRVLNPLKEEVAVDGDDVFSVSGVTKL